MTNNELYRHILNTARIPSFSSYEERLHPYIQSVFDSLPDVNKIKVPGNNIIYRLGANQEVPPVALAAHLDKINHFGRDYPDELPVKETDKYLEGAMDDCAGLGILLSIAESWNKEQWPDMFFFFSEMEESKGLKEHPKLLRNNGKGYHHGMGAERIAKQCLKLNTVPDEVITVDTTPLFNGKPGLALYAHHWELNDLKKPSSQLRKLTHQAINDFLAIDDRIKIDNNTNDYLHYGEIFNKVRNNAVVSMALEPAIFPYHQRGERVFKEDIRTTIKILQKYLLEKKI